MSFIRSLGLAFLVLGGASLVVTSGAFTDVTLDRTSEVSVAGDQSGLVGLDIARPVDGQGNSRLVTLTNNAGEELTLTVGLTVNTDAGVSLPSGQATNTLSPGESATVDVTVNPSKNPQTVEFAVTGSATTGDIEVSLTRSTTVEQVQTGPCAGPRTVYDETVNGDIDVDNGSVELASNVQVQGSVEAAGCVILGNGAQIKDEVSAGKDVRLDSRAQIKGDVESGGDVTLGDGSATQIQGEVESGGDVTLGSKAQIKGDVELSSGTTLSMGIKSKITGEVDADDASTVTIECESGATIDGTDCSAYTL